MAKSKFFTVPKILSLVCLVLSILLLTTFFMPTYTLKIGEEKTNLSGVELIQSAFLDDEGAAKMLASSMDLRKSESERKTALKIFTAYGFTKANDAEAYGTSIMLNIAILLISVVGIIVSLWGFFKKGPGIGAIITNAIIAICALTFVICVLVAVGNLNGESTNVVGSGAGAWIAAVSAVGLIGCSIVGKLLNKSKKR